MSTTNIKQPVVQCLRCWEEFLSYEDTVGHEKECTPSDPTVYDLTGRALELADTASDMIWGGERGWERATDSQYQALLRILRNRLKTHPEA
jgi:hypothetical protein